MKKATLLRNPTRVADISFDDMENDDSNLNLRIERFLHRHRRLVEE